MILLLAGTAEARDLARRLAKAGVQAEASVAGAVSEIEAMPLPTRVGGFGGEDGFLRYLDEAKPTGVIDATHPFAARITDRTARSCAERGLPYLRLNRPAWEAGDGDNWNSVPDAEALPDLIPEGASIFLSVGRKELSRYTSLTGRKVVIRSIDPPDALPDGWISTLGKPPFPLQEEVALFQQHKIDWLVTKNAGGASSATKLIAARHLNLPVAMIARPPLPPGIETVATAEEALIWALRHT